MAKVIIKSEKITPFGGIYYASVLFEQTKYRTAAHHRSCSDSL